MLVPSRRRHAEGWRFPTIARPCLHTPSPIPSYPVIFTEPLLDIVLCLDTEIMYMLCFFFLFSVSLTHHPSPLRLRPKRTMFYKADLAGQEADSSWRSWLE